MQTQSKLDIVDEKYQRTIIYGIVCLITKEKYVGSTHRTLDERIAQHIRDRNCSAWQILERGNYKAYVIQHYPCNTKREVLAREGAWQRAYKASFGEKLVNKKIEGVFIDDNPEAKQEYNKQYRDTHREESKAYDKKYRKTHREKRVEYRETHRKESKAYDKKYRETHKEEIKAYRKIQWTCNRCNKTMRFNSQYNHKKTCKNKPSE
jgi:hypothetical protein